MRRCLKEPIQDIFEAANLLYQAADADLQGDTETAASLIREADMQSIFEWTDSIWGRRSSAVHLFKVLPDSPPHLQGADRPMPRMPDAATRRLIRERDGFHCRFCEIPVIRREVRITLRARYPEALRWGRSNVEQHAAFQCMWLQYDHVLPNQRGGESSLANVVVTCAACNFGRMEWTVEEAGLIDPRTVPVQPSWAGFSSWDGLERLLG